MKRVAIIGTAGRDRTKPMTKALWDWMLQDAKNRVKPNWHLVSGGAAWADHLAIALFLDGLVAELTLHLPAPFDGVQFVGPSKSAASAANYYHELFSQVIQANTLRQIHLVSQLDGMHGTVEPVAPGYGAMFARNRKVALVDGMLAYTFGEGDVPADGGTKSTWDMCRGIRQHISLPIIGV